LPIRWLVVSEAIHSLEIVESISCSDRDAA